MTTVEGAPARLAFVDLETTGLDPWHEPWEFGLVIRARGADDRELLYLARPDLARADPTALRIGRYYGRTLTVRAGRPSTVHDLAHLDAGVTRLWSDPRALARTLAYQLAGAVLVANNAAFDATMLGRFLRRHNQAAMWHHRLVDVGSVAFGALTVHAAWAGAHPPGGPPWSPAEMAEMLGVTQPEEDRHTALGDARAVRDLYDAAIGVGAAR